MPRGRLYIATLTKESRQKLNLSKIRAEVDRMGWLAVGTASRRKNWRFEIHESARPLLECGVYTIVWKIHFQKINGHISSQEKDWAKIYARLSKVSKTSNRTWSVSTEHPPTVQIQIPKKFVVHVKDDVKDYAPINLDQNKHFDHIFGLEPQIRRIMSALRLAKQTNMQKRLHCLLYGQPGCGKSELITAVGKMLGKEKEHYIQFDATSTTQAGAINIFLTSPYIPPVLLVEEIEKTHPNDQRWMLGLLDQRAEIRQTNFRVGNRAKNVRVFCIATCNDLQLFKSIMSGALASRFSHQILCPRPKKEMLEMILRREIAQVPGGKLEWIAPTLQFAELYEINDPREIIAICLTGQDDLLNGKFQEDYRLTSGN